MMLVNQANIRFIGFYPCDLWANNFAALTGTHSPGVSGPDGSGLALGNDSAFIGVDGFRPHTHHFIS
jgi:hypothetical protein